MRAAPLTFKLGRTIITEPMRITDAMGQQCLGRGMHRTQLVWRGGDEESMFIVHDSRDTVLGDFSVLVESGSLRDLVTYRRTKEGPGVIPSTGNRLQNVWADLQSRVDVGVRYESKVNVNNDCGVMTNVHMNNYREAGFWFEGSQSKFHNLYSCRFGGNGVGKYGIGGSGSYTMFGGGGGGNTVADVSVVSQADGLAFYGLDLESSARLIETNVSGDAQPIIFSGGKWMCDKLAEDGYMVRVLTAGPLTIRGMCIGSGSQRVPMMELRTLNGYQGCATLDDNVFDSTGALELFQLVTQNYDVFGSNLYRDWNRTVRHK